jgi:FkbM family methyltransferase
MKNIYFQIGTNNGNDNFKKMVINDNPDLIILVEPNIDLIDEIKDNYNDILSKTVIYNNAIYYENDKELELFFPSVNGIYDKKNKTGILAENGYKYSDVHFSLLPMNDWGKKEDMVKLKTKSITFDKICENENITTIDLLMIDTEGFDSEIIKMIDLNKYKIKKLIFEKWLFPTDAFTKYNNNDDELGINGFNNSIKKLKEHNYEITESDDKCDIVAILKN